MVAPFFSSLTPLLLCAAALSAAVCAFQPSVPLAGLAPSSSSSSSSLRMEYIPDGLSKAQWEALKKKEREANKGKNLGAVGTNRFESRSLSAWQEAGGKHLFPVDPKKVKTGQIKMKDVPYMQRGGSWDNSDLKGEKKIAWSQKDKDYKAGGERAAQSVSILGGQKLPWNQKFQPMSKDALDPRRQTKQAAGNKPKLNVSKEQEKRLREEVSKEKKGLFGLW